MLCEVTRLISLATTSYWPENELPKWTNCLARYYVDSGFSLQYIAYGSTGEARRHSENWGKSTKWRPRDRRGREGDVSIGELNPASNLPRVKKRGEGGEMNLINIANTGRFSKDTSRKARFASKFVDDES